MTEPPEQGLSAAEVEARVERGQINIRARRPSRSVAEILRANIFTRFNALLGTLLVVILAVGQLQDALFGVVLVANAAIGIIQELRAKRTLDRLALLSAPRTRVVRDGQVAEIAVGDVVVDDVLELSAGDQLVVDGVVVAGEMEVDESLVSGEAEPVTKHGGDEVLSGSFVVAGSGRAQAVRVGSQAYAQTLAEQARRFTLVHSELREGINRILNFVTWAIVPTAAVLVISQLRSTGLRDALSGSVAGIGAMVPEGLVLLTSVAFAAAVVRLARRRVLVQELNAVEGLARVDVVCVDKTGTLTDAHMAVTDVEPLTDGVDQAGLLGALAAADPHPNASLKAVADAYPSSDLWVVRSRVPFSSARKWASVTFEQHGTWLIGAPEVLLAGDERAPALERATTLAETGHRVLLVARAPDPPQEVTLPAGLEPALLVVLEERVRADAAETLAYFAGQQVAVKVISGDNPETVAAIAARVGVAGAEAAMDARSLPTAEAELAQVVEEHTVFGRVLPHQKRAMVAALQARGHVVAMTGDGVNDVLALKDADIGVAMASGSDATRAVAQLVLLDNSFAALPGVVAEGRRVIANVERVANLFVTKTVYAMMLALATGALTVPFPFLPRHLTIVSTLTIGVPGFFLALAPNARRFQPGFVRRVLNFAVPAGLVAAAATFSAYGAARAEGVSLLQARTTATIVLFGVGLWVLTILARPVTRSRGVLEVSMAGAFAIVLAIPGLRRFFALSLPPLDVEATAVGITAFGVAVLETGRWAATEWGRSGGTAGLGRALRRQLDFLARRLQPNETLGLSLTASLALIALAGWALGAVTQDVLSSESLNAVDRPVLRFFVRHREAWLTTTNKLVTSLGSPAVLIPLVVVMGLAWRWRAQTWRALGLLAGAYGGAEGLFELIKVLVGRPRPPVAMAVAHFSGSAFPSGHAALSAAVWGSLAALAAAATPRWARKVAAWTTAVLIAGLVGETRLYLGAHWLTDVVGGWALGAFWLFALLTTTRTFAAMRAEGTRARKRLLGTDAPAVVREVPVRHGAGAP